jgi:hypothetical protein
MSNHANVCLNTHVYDIWTGLQYIVGGWENNTNS